MFVSSPSQPEVAKVGRSLIFTLNLNISSNRTIEAKKIGQRPPNLYYEFDVMKDYAVKLTGVERGYFGGKTTRWSSVPSRMGFLSSYPTSYLLTHDEPTVDLFMHYMPEHFVPLHTHSISLVPNPANTLFFQGALI